MLRDQDYDLLVMVSQAITIIKCVLTLFFFIILERKEGDRGSFVRDSRKGGG